MKRFLINIFNLIFSPSHGWNEVSYCSTPTKTLIESYLLKFLAFTSLTALAQFFYHSDVSLISSIEEIIIQFGGLFAALYVGNLAFETLLPRIVDGKVNHTKALTVSVYSIALVAIYEMIENLMPVELGFLKFLPIFSALIIFKSARYLDVSKDSVFSFFLVSAITLQLLPLTMVYCLNLLRL